MQQIRAIVLYAKPWRVIDDVSGQVREGVTIEYVMNEDLKPVNNEDGSVGYKIVKESINISKFHELVKVPGIYDMTYRFMIQKGKPVMRLQDIEFVAEVD